MAGVVAFGTSSRTPGQVPSPVAVSPHLLRTGALRQQVGGPAPAPVQLVKVLDLGDRRDRAAGSRDVASAELDGASRSCGSPGDTKATQLIRAASDAVLTSSGAEAATVSWLVKVSAELFQSPCA